MDVVLCGEDDDVTGLTTRQAHEARDPIKHRLRLPFPDTDAYRQLKVATEVFVMLNCGVFTERPRLRALDRDFAELEAERRRELASIAGRAAAASPLHISTSHTSSSIGGVRDEWPQSCAACEP